MTDPELLEKLERICGLLDEGADPHYVLDDEREVIGAFNPHRMLSALRDVVRLDLLEACCDDLSFYTRPGGEPEPVLSWFAGDGDSVATTTGATWREAIDAALEWANQPAEEDA